MRNDRINRVLKCMGIALVLACLSFSSFGSIPKHAKFGSSDIETLNRGWARISRMDEWHVGLPLCPGSAEASPYHACCGRVTCEYPPCAMKDELKIRNISDFNNVGFYPCANIRSRCVNYEQCEYVEAGGEQGTTGNYGWVPKRNAQNAQKEITFPTNEKQ